jgi:putative ABC transport system permease protein
MDTLFQDLRYAVRSLRRTPGFTAVVVVVMALGIGVNVTIFSMTYGLMFRPWPLPEPDRIIELRMTDPRHGWDNGELSWLNFHDLRDRSKSYEVMGAYWDHQAIVTIDRDPERFSGASITSGVLPAIAVKPILGRNFTKDEEVWGRNWNQVIISERIWRTRFGGTASALGKTLRLNGRTREIVGVMPKGNLYPEDSDFWIPAGYDAKHDSRTDGSLTVIGRLKPGVTLKQATAEGHTLWSGLIRDYPELKDNGIRVVRSQENWARGVRPIMIIMLVAVLFVLMIACANVANLLLARAATRRREISLRVALGASRGRVVRQLLTESILLAGLGGVLGIALGYWGNTIWPLGIPLEKPWFLQFPIDAPVLFYTAAITVFAGVVFGLAPALHASDENLTEALREGGSQAGHSRAGNRLRHSLVVAEIAFSIVLLIGAGLMIRTFMKLDRAGRQVRTEGVVAGRVLLPVALYPNGEQRARFFTEMQQRLQSEPGVISVAGLNNLPLGRDNWSRTVKTPDTPDDKSSSIVAYWTLMPGSLKATGVSLRKGREFTFADDSASQRVALISENAAKRLYPGRDPIGQRIRYSGEPDSIPWRTIVGVTGDIIQGVESDDKVIGSIWVPELQDPVQTLWVAVESKGNGAQGAAALRRVVRGLNPDIAVYDVRTMKEQLRFALWVRRLFASLIGVFGALALVIAAVGLYGVMAYNVAQRTQEIGIRMALGAEASSVLRLVVGQAFRLTLLGIGIGLAVAFGVTRFMTAAIQGVSPTDPPTFTTVTLLLAFSGLLAAWVPAWRAVRVNPMNALRCQ